MISAVICINPQCTEVNVVKTNVGDLDVAIEEITCGACGSPVEETTP
jgi:transcription elongation factor Elf1